jgi:hypothetical protein
MPQLQDEAQVKFFSGVAVVAPRDRKEWNLQIATNIAKASDNGIDDMAKGAQSSYIRLWGNMAQEILSLSPEKQAQYQQAAIEMMQKTRFPIKFDAASFREALFAVPENVRTVAYKAQLARFEEKSTPIVSEIAQTDESSSDEGAAIPIEILPQALPNAPESMRVSDFTEPESPAEELEERFTAAPAE